MVEEAFACLIGLAETVPEISAQAECVKAALISLKECAEVRIINCSRRRSGRLSPPLPQLRGAPAVPPAHRRSFLVRCHSLLVRLVFPLRETTAVACAQGGGCGVARFRPVFMEDGWG